jgi:hypothetical protein
VQQRRVWTRLWGSYCYPTAAKAPDNQTEGFLFLWVLQVKKRANERTRTADLLITSDPSGVAWVCLGLQSPIFKGFSFLWIAPGCTVLRSRWCQSGANVPQKVEAG